MKSRRSHHPAAENVERTADADRGSRTGLTQVLGQPQLLTRRSQSHEKQLRAARANLVDDAGDFGVGEKPVARAGDDQSGKTRFHDRRRVRSRALGAAQEIHRQALARGLRAETLDQFDAGDAFVQIRTAPPRDAENADRVAEREGAGVHDVAEAFVLLRVHDHLGSERDDLRARAFARERHDPRGSFIRIENVELAAENLYAVHASSRASAYRATIGRKRSASAAGISSSGRRHEPA